MLRIEKPSAQKTKGILYILSAAACFAFMTFFVRESGEVPTMEKCFFRNLPAVVISSIVLLRTDEKFHIKKESRTGLLMRCLFGTSGMIANFWAIDHLMLADANMLNKMSPFFAMLLSIFILKEKPDKFQWGVLFAAIAGAMLVIRPTAGIASAPAFVGLFSGFGAGAAYTFVRKLGMIGERGQIIVFCFSAFTCVVCLPYILLFGRMLTMREFGFLTLAGIAGSGGQFSITAAYQAAPAKEISVFDYMQVVFSALIGFVFFGEVPDALSFAGYAVIIGAAVVNWNRARKAPEN